MSFNGKAAVPPSLRIGAYDGFYEVSGIEDPTIPQRWVPKAVQDYEALVLAGVIAQEEPYDIVIGLARGGLATAQTVAYSNGIKPLLALQTDGYDELNQPIYPPRIVATPDPERIPRGKRVLITDELADRGGALVVGVDWVVEYCDPAVVHTAVTYVKDRERAIEPTHYVRVVDDVWMDFETQASAERRAFRLAELSSQARDMADVHGWLSMQTPHPDVVPMLIAQSQTYENNGFHQQSYL